MRKNRKYQDFLIEELKDHNEAVAYLNAALEESLKGDEESQYLFLIALRNIAEAQGELGNLAKKLEWIRRISIKFFQKKAILNGIPPFL